MMRHPFTLASLLTLALSATGCLKPLGCVELLQCLPPGASLDEDAAGGTQAADASVEAGRPEDAAPPLATEAPWSRDSDQNSATIEAGGATKSTWSPQSSKSSAVDDGGASESRLDAGIAAQFTRHAEAGTVVATCGDGQWEPPMEACDDGNTVSLDGCDSNCQPEIHGVVLTEACKDIAPGNYSCGTDGGHFHFCYADSSSMQDLAARACSACFGACSDVVEAMCEGTALAFAHTPALPECQTYFVYDGSGSCRGREGQITMQPGTVMADCPAAGGIASKGGFR